MSLNYYEFVPCHYCTLPGLSFDACFKMTKIELELLCDPEQFLFIENSIRGGVSVVSHRHGLYSSMPIICTAMQRVSPFQQEI